jgi:hypothetical protein
VKIPQAIFLRVHAALLNCYPAPFRAKYELQLTDAARRLHEEHNDHGKLAAALTWDTLNGAWRENMRIPGPKSTFSYLGFATLFSILLLACYIGMQQKWRRAADDAPQAMVEQLRNGAGPSLTMATQEISTPAWLHGHNTFAATYDADGNATASDARLHGALPQPPRGIFNVMRKQGWYSVSWQPEPGVRVALTGAQLPSRGFAVAGQSLTPGEDRTMHMGVLVLFMWGLMMVGLGLSAVTSRKPQAPN